MGEILLKPTGGQLTVVCRWCGAIQVEPSANEEFYEDTSLRDELYASVRDEVIKRAQAE